jgi:hypothetical protein
MVLVVRRARGDIRVRRRLLGHLAGRSDNGNVPAENRALSDKAPLPSIFMALAVVTCLTAPAGAQNLVLSGVVQRDMQRFPEGDVPTRLDGSATGWMVGAAVRLWSHLALAVEGSDAGTIEDARTTTLDIDGRTIAITSTFRHHTRTVAALGGYSHMLSPRVRVAYLVGVSFTEVGREFASNAPGLVLVAPSDPAASGRSALVDRFRNMTGGVDAFVRISRRLHAVAGVRAQRVTLPLDVSGWSVKTFVGAGWGL